MLASSSPSATRPPRVLGIAWLLLMTLVHDPVAGAAPVAGEAARAPGDAERTGRAVRSGWLLRATGQVLVKRHGPGATAEVATAPTPLGYLDDLEVHSGSAQIQLGSGRIIELQAGTLISLIGPPHRSDLFLARGVLLLKPGASGEDDPVALAMEGGRVTLRSRTALLRKTAGQTQVQIDEGTAQVLGRVRRIDLLPQQMVTLMADGMLGEPVAVPADQLVAQAEQVLARGALPDLSPTPQNPVTVVPTPDTPSGQAVPAPSAASSEQSVQQGADHPFIEWTSLRVLRDKGYISQAEFDSAMHDLYDTLGSRVGKSGTLALGKWATTIYGFAQADYIWDTTQSFTEIPGNTALARPDTYAGQNGRNQFSVRNSRFGLRVAAPALRYVRASAVIEMDFFGAASSTTEQAFYTNPAPRLRHAYLKLETPIVDLLFGQYWELFGWQPAFQPTVVNIPGVVGEVFSRATQLRVSHLFVTRPISVELAVAALRPPQRDSMVPDFQGGLRLTFNQWTAVHTSYMAATTVIPASIAVSGVARSLAMPNLAAAPASSTRMTGLGIAADVYLPIVPATPTHMSNSLSVLGEFSIGDGISDLYTSLTGGVPLSAKALPPATKGGVAPAFPADYDPGLMAYDTKGNRQLPEWMMFLVGLEYYPPGVRGRLGLFGTVARSQLLNVGLYGNPTKVRDHELFFEGGLFGDVSEAVRLGLDYTRTEDTYVDGITPKNNAVHLSAFFFF